MASTTLSVSSASISTSKTPCLPNSTTVAYFKPNTTSLSTSIVGKRIRLYRSSKTRPIGAKNASIGINCQASSSVLPSALLFDCDGVLVDTEKDGHRISFNDTFQEVSLFSSLFLLCLSASLSPIFELGSFNNKQCLVLGHGIKLQRT